MQIVSQKAIWHRRAQQTMVMLLLAPQFAGAAAWITSPTLDTSIIYTDNVRLAPPHQETSDVLLTVLPAIDVKNDTARLQLEGHYGVEALYFSKDTASDDYRQNLLGKAHGVLVDDTFFVDASASIRQQPVSPANNGIGSIAALEPATEVKYWKMSPTWTKSVGNVALFDAGLDLDFIDYPSSGNDSYGREWFAKSESGPYFREFHWDVLLSKKDVYRYAGQAGYSQATANLDLRYHVFTNWTLIGSVGNEDNVYPYDPLYGPPPGGKMWNLGTSWAPSAFFAIEGGVGERGFGSTRFGKIHYASSTLQLLAKYTEDISSSYQLQRNFVEANQSVTGQPISFDGQYFTEKFGVFTSRKTELRVDYNSAKIILGINLVQDRRRFEDTGSVELVHGGGGNLRLIMSSRSAFLASYGQQSFKYADSQEDKTRTSSVGYERKYSQWLRGSLIAERAERNLTNTSDGDYVASSVALRTTMLF